MRFDIDLDTIDELLKTINASVRVRSMGVHAAGAAEKPRSSVVASGQQTASGHVYADEPIIRRGSQMASYLPEPIRRMRELARRPEARSWSDARLFVEQAHLMASYEDDFSFHGTFMSYFPTYDAMNNEQLRGYFSWRTQVRHGIIEETSTSFAYVYLYELLNGIGVTPGVRAFEALEAFWRAYRQFEPIMDRYLRAWLVDYVVWHGLNPELARPYLALRHNQAVEVLRRTEKATLAAAAQTKGRKRVPTNFDADPAAARELFDALTELSSYRITESRLFKDSPDDLRIICCAVFSRLVRYYRGGRTQGYVESLFGTRHESTHLMFASAVFYPTERHADCTVELDETCSYRCSGGLWWRNSLRDGGEKSTKIGQVLRACDRCLREALGYPHPLKKQGEPKYLIQIITREIADYLAWKKTSAPQRINIDLSKLADIRSVADKTCESLLVDEERDLPVSSDSNLASSSPLPLSCQAPDPQPASQPPATSQPAVSTSAPGSQPPVVGQPAGPQPPAASQLAAPGAASAIAAPFGLTPTELQLLQALLAKEVPATGASSWDLTVDAINEKLFDLVGDTVVEFGVDGVPALIEDYVEDVQAALV